ncbi:DNA (cytosine-5-)-methyltransferase [Lysinibacillus fusiformis]|uniref:DNA (cytosine-5-)-methyltransferase n=1 Tax=Lysinibacillus fusiformis TaxID=28031 RepID=UPI00263B4A32|nr:DNA (cytosine-5-)-methyltransferase [Lysinibacillus fusiformis]MDC6267232.1 DNA (cytosine-5-)-methyltransferase [Lysinibacillus sphaericus]MDN4968334.1 DNA (cytosine-5-)-methyltransferase [Lysinibacillus fusiformis]MDN4968508.1 DNA (cytosine-5-)-methyltransferase [Lysinibacillus fusiformis]
MIIIGITVLSLFDGMSCGHLVLDKLGIEIDTYYASEIEQSTIEVTKHNYPDTVHLGDVTKWKEWDLPKIDLIIGGSPCQGFSRQGAGLNFNDPRSKLFFEFVDIVNHHKEINPYLNFMLENVNMKREWQDVITDYLGVDPVHINSDVLVPHNRPRTYWTNFDINCVEQVDYKLLNLLDDIILEDYIEVGAIKVCKSFSEKSIELISFEEGEVRIKQAVKKGYIVAKLGDGINISFPTSKTRRGRVTSNKSSCLDTSCDIGVYDQHGQIRRFTMNELEKLQGVPVGYTSSMDDSFAKKALGNGWTVDVIAHILRSIKR